MQKLKKLLLPGMLAGIFVFGNCGALAEDLITEDEIVAEASDAVGQTSEAGQGANASGQDTGTAGNNKKGKKSSGTDSIIIEEIEIVSSKEAELTEEEEKKISKMVEESNAAFEKTMEQQKNSALPEGFYVDPNQYPAADINKNTKEIYQYLTEEMGLNHGAACGVLANIHLESSFNPRIFGDGGTSYGICQWHLGRFSGLVGYCRQNGLDYNTLDGQLAYMYYELEHGYTGVLDTLKSVPDTAEGAYEAGAYWCLHFEMPDSMYLRAQRRGNLAANEYFPRDFSEIPEEDEEDVETSGEGIGKVSLYGDEFQEAARLSLLPVMVDGEFPVSHEQTDE